MRKSCIITPFLLFGCVHADLARIGVFGKVNKDGHISITIKNTHKVDMCVRAIDFDPKSDLNIFRIYEISNSVGGYYIKHNKIDTGYVSLGGPIKIKPGNSLTRVFNINNYYTLNKGRYAVYTSIPITECEYLYKMRVGYPNGRMAFGIMGRADYSDWSDRLKLVNHTDKKWARHTEWINYEYLYIKPD